MYLYLSYINTTAFVYFLFHKHVSNAAMSWTALCSVLHAGTNQQVQTLAHVHVINFHCITSAWICEDRLPGRHLCASYLHYCFRNREIKKSNTLASIGTSHISSPYDNRYAFHVSFIKNRILWYGRNFIANELEVTAHMLPRQPVIDGSTQKYYAATF